MSYVVAVVGATGNVGREMLNILDERKFPISRVDVVASRSSQGREVSFGDKTLKIQALDFYDFAHVVRARPKPMPPKRRRLVVW
jgi:aspartate-semialdehyde dehydrogenase